MNIAFLETASGSGSMWSSIIMMALIIVVFWFFIIRPQRKKDKETAKMRSELQVGDEIVTIGGIIGIIVSMKEDSLVIETGSDRSKVRLARWAISGKNTTAEPK
ncbi:MAG: preprotein translocase subunit YajC [Angelakisella sp.]|jgi:preprotein translocase, yajC subunit|uniref:preprotein translocase subunit YajC n=1 Tax=Angelakisella sp. TaxID=1935177 RepID=UPI0015A52551|nr:preprotein translocase subunit YajC [Clostridiales bacterium]